MNFFPGNWLSLWFEFQQFFDGILIFNGFLGVFIRTGNHTMTSKTACHDRGAGIDRTTRVDMTEFARNLALFDMDFVAEFDRLAEFALRDGFGCLGGIGCLARFACLAEFGCLAGFGRQPKKGKKEYR